MNLTRENLEKNPIHFLSSSRVRPLIWGSIAQIPTEPAIHFYKKWLFREIHDAGHDIWQNNVKIEVDILEEFEMVERLPSHEALQVVLFKRLDAEPWEWVDRVIQISGVEVPKLPEPPQIQISNWP